jgi:hypothetical protein
VVMCGGLGGVGPRLKPWVKDGVGFVFLFLGVTTYMVHLAQGFNPGFFGDYGGVFLALAKAVCGAILHLALAKAWVSGHPRSQS